MPRGLPGPLSLITPPAPAETAQRPDMLSALLDGPQSAQGLATGPQDPFPSGSECVVYTMSTCGQVFQVQVKLTNNETRSCPTMAKALPDQQTRFRSSPPAICQTRGGWGQPAGRPFPHGCSVLPLGSCLNTWEHQVTGPGSLHPADSCPLTPAEQPGL